MKTYAKRLHTIFYSLNINEQNRHEVKYILIQNQLNTAGLRALKYSK